MYINLDHDILQLLRVSPMSVIKWSVSQISFVLINANEALTLAALLYLLPAYVITFFSAYLMLYISDYFILKNVKGYVCWKTQKSLPFTSSG